MTIPRALFFLSDFGGGGAQKTMLNLAGAMPANLLEVELVVANSSGPARQWVPGVMSYTDLECSAGMARAIPSLARTIRRLGPDVILSTMLHANIGAWLASRLAASGAAFVARETNSHRAQPELGALLKRSGAIAYRRADTVIALSEGVRRELIEDMALDPARTVTIPNPVQVGALRQQIAAARKKSSPLPPWQGPTILAIGRLFPQKAYEYLLDAVARHVDGARLVILGEGPERQALERRAEQAGLAGRLVMPGFTNEVAPYLAHADLFALSSRWEGFGHVIVEAMAAGLPVVSTNCPHGPADIIEDGKTGLLVPAEDADALGAALARVARDPDLARRIASAGLRSAGRYEAEKVARRYATVLTRAAAESALVSNGRMSTAK